MAPSTINKKHTKDVEHPYTAKLCQDLVMWCWSRKPEQIVFDEDITAFVMHAAMELGAKFSPKICLIQSEDVRFKLIRIAASVAGRTFSTDDGVTLRVRKCHIEFAYNFLHHIYSKSSCGYAQLSEAARERENIQDPAGVRAILEGAGELVRDLIGGLLEHRTFTARDISDYAGIDIYQARAVISQLVRARAIIKEYAYYVKKDAFKRFLLRLNSELNPDIETTQTDADTENEDHVTADTPIPNQTEAIQ